MKQNGRSSKKASASPEQTGVAERSIGKTVTIAAILVAVITLLYVFPFGTVPNPSPTPTQFTEGPIRDLVLPPDSDYAYFSKKTRVGREVVYHLFRENVTSHAETDLTPTATWDNTQPAVSRELIVFRSERAHGLVSVDLEGHNERILTTLGNAPTMSPDSQFVAFTGQRIDDPRHRSHPGSKLYILKLSTGTYKTLGAVDAAQPKFSPDGHRLVYWSLVDGTRRVESLDLESGIALTVASGLGCVWSPTYTPDGNFVLFLSDFDGNPRLWRVAVNPLSGAAIAVPKVLEQFAADTMEIAISVKYMAFTRRAQEQSMQELSVEHARQSSEVGQQLGSSEVGQQLRSPNFSKAGRQVAAYTTFSHAEEIVLLDTDGREIRRLTNNGAQNRGPRIAGELVVYYSNQHGNHYQIYEVKTDGSGNEQLTFSNADVGYVAFSPDAHTISFYINNRGSAIMDLKDRRMRMLPQFPATEVGSQFVATSWSPDGIRIAGHEMRQDGSSAGIWIYDIKRNVYMRLTTTGVDPVWRRDNARILYQDDDSLLNINTVTKAKQSMIRINSPFRLSGGFALSPDEKTLWFGIEPEGVTIFLTGQTQESAPAAH